MPDQTYTAKDTQTGKTVTFKWNAPVPPTQADMEDIFAEARQTPVQAPDKAPVEDSGGILSTAADVGVGALKGLGNTVYGLGKVVHDYTPIGRISDAIQPGAFEPAAKPPELTPTNPAQQVGFTGEQIGEFFVPLGEAAKLGKAAEIARAGVLGTAQGGPTTGAISAGLTAVLPGAGAASKVAGKLQESAEKSVAQGLGASKEWAKAEARKLAPQMLERGVGGSRPQMLARAAEESQNVGRRLGEAYRAAGARGETVSGLAIRGELQFAKDALMVPDAAGNMIPIEGAQPVLKKLDRLEQFVARLGDDVPVDKAAKIKTAWDRIVAKAGLYGPKAASNATDSAAAWATREGTSAFRTALQSDSPDIAALSKEYAFWTGLKKVLRETELRTQAQGGGLLRGITTAAGAGSGFASGNDFTDSLEKAFIGAAAGRQMVKLLQSPYWKTAVAGPMKAKLAEALASGGVGQIGSASSKIIASLPAQVKLALSQ